MVFVTRVVLEKGAEKYQLKEYTAHGAPVRKHDDFKSTDREEVEVQAKRTRHTLVPVIETETPGDVDDNEAAKPTVVNRKTGERVRRKPDAFAFITNSE